MTAARKLPPPASVRYERGEITVRPGEPLMQQECTRCGTLRKQQFIEGYHKGGALWAVLPCTSCPLELGGCP